MLRTLFIWIVLIAAPTAVLADKNADERLMGAVGEAGPERIETLIEEHGADVNTRGEYERTPLMEAARMNEPAVVRLLLDHGARVDARDHRGFTALIPAVGSVGKIKLLVEAGVQLDARTIDGKTALHRAAEIDKPRSAEALIDAGVNVDARQEQGWTPLMWALREQSSDTARVLIEGGAGINARAAQGQTPLMVAAVSGAPETVQLLLDAGADASLEVESGNTAWHYAKENNEAVKNHPVYWRLNDARFD